MDITANVALLAGLSAASERLVEIFRGIFSIEIPEKPLANAKEEAKRVAKIDALAILAGLITAALAKVIFTLDLKFWEMVAFGVLAGAGSGFWNSVLAYLLQLKNLKKAEALRVKLDPPEVKMPRAA